jgi:hypothetical protein
MAETVSSLEIGDTGPLDGPPGPHPVRGGTYLLSMLAPHESCGRAPLTAASGQHVSTRW